MRRQIATVVAAVGACAAVVACAAALAAESAADNPPPPKTPATTRAATTRPLSPAGLAAKQYHDFLKAGDRTAASKMLAVSPRPVRDAERRVKRLADAMANPGWDFAVLEAKESGDLAVVLINDYLKDGRKTIDIKPWYLLRQNGEWRLLGKYTDFEMAEYEFDKARIEEYRKLETWAERRTPELKREQPDCGC